MVDYNNHIKKYAVTLGVTPGVLWLVGGILGVYFSNGTTLYLVS
jgi:hypothetical protein